jgi:3-keto-5-aminohexanoate cleavage enzyme
MKRKIIISVAPVAGLEPLIPELVSEDVIKCIDLGASMCHLHSKTREGSLSPDITALSETFDIIRKNKDVVVQVSTGGVSTMNIKERCYPLNYQYAETASLNGGSTNLGEAVYTNSFEDIRYCAKLCYEKKVLPEIEVFDPGMINNINLLIEEGIPFRSPLLFNLVFGHKGGIPSTIDALVAFKSFVPNDALWGITHYGRDNWTLLATAIAMGACLVRIGFEDSRYISDNLEASYNYQVVEKLVDLVRAMDLEVARPAEARNILKIT